MTPQRTRTVAVVVAAVSAAATTQPAGPKEAYAAYAAALVAGDVATAKRYVLADARHAAFLDGQAELRAAEEGLRVAVAKAFPDATPTRKPSTRPDNPAVKVDRDTATLLPRDAAETVKLRRVDGEWKVDLNAMYAGPVLDEIDQFRVALRDTMTAVATDVSAGKYKTYADVQSDLETRIKMKLATPDASASTRPAL